MSKLKIVPVELKEANQFIAEHHRHHKPVQGHRFSIGVIKEDQLVGVACIGRPVARAVNAKEVLEVTRLCTDGTKNVCSCLYSAAARVGKELGYKKIQTYILDSEYGSSLLASNWSFDGVTKGNRNWNDREGYKTGNGKRRTDQPTCNKHRYIKILNN